MDNIVNGFMLSVAFIIIWNFLPLEQNIDDSVLNSKISIFFEIIEVILIQILIYYSIYNNDIVNGFTLSVAFIEHLKQIIFCYRFGGGLKNLVTALIYIILIVYNTINANYLFIGIWILGLIMHLVSYFTKKSFMGKVCLFK